MNKEFAVLFFALGGCAGWLASTRRSGRIRAASPATGAASPVQAVRSSMSRVDPRTLRASGDVFDLASELRRPEYQQLAGRLLTLDDIGAFWKKAEAAIGVVREAIRNEMAAHPDQFDALLALQDQFRGDVSGLTGQLDAILPTITEVKMAYAATVAVSGRMEDVAKEEPAVTSVFNKVDGVVGAMTALATFSKA